MFIDRDKVTYWLIFQRKKYFLNQQTSSGHVPYFGNNIYKQAFLSFLSNICVCWYNSDDAAASLLSSPTVTVSFPSSLLPTCTGKACQEEEGTIYHMTKRKQIYFYIFIFRHTSHEDCTIAEYIIILQYIILYYLIQILRIIPAIVFCGSPLPVK